MSISKKHFEAVAKIINNNVYGNVNNKKNVVNSFIEYFKTQNKNFNSFRFYNACFINELGSSNEKTKVETVELLKEVSNQMKGGK